MRLIPFKEQNCVYAKSQPQYNPLPAHRAVDGKVTCCWQLTWWERWRVLWTGRVWHQILTFNQQLQPQLLMADKPFIETE